MSLFSIEFTDCFGRTRKVDKDEYDKIKNQNEDIIVEKPPQSVPETVTEEVGDNFLKQREEWRKQEELNKESSEIYYQDVLFDGELFQKIFHSYIYDLFGSDECVRVIDEILLMCICKEKLTVR